MAYFDVLNHFDSFGKYGMPQLAPCTLNLELVKWIPWNQAKSYPENKSNTGVHFFQYDQAFAGVWNDKGMLHRLIDFTCAATPDFSVYTDMPLAFQVWQRFRSQYLGCYMQQVMGLPVVATLCWSTEDSFEFTFDGIPKGTVCITNSLGIFQNDHKTCNLHRAGLKEAIKRIEPKKIWVYGGPKPFYPDYEYGYIEPFYVSMKRRAKEYRAKYGHLIKEAQRRDHFLEIE